MKRMRSVFRFNVGFLLASMLALNGLLFVKADVNQCLLLRSQLDDAISKFMKCVVENSRPFNLCQSCVQFFMLVKNVHSQIVQDAQLYAQPLFRDGLTCDTIIEAADKVQPVLKLLNTIDDIWATSNCDDCFTEMDMTSGNYTVKQNVLDFYRSQNDLQMCIFNSTHIPTTMDPFFTNFTANPIICSNCKQPYVSLTTYFASIRDDDENNMCMDIVDAFNNTRFVWSKGYKCNYMQFDEWKIVAITTTSVLLTISFYIAVRVMNKKQELTFVTLTE